MKYFLDHIAVNMVHEAEMISFYRDVLAFPAERLDTYRAGTVPFPSFRLTSDTIIDLFPESMWKGMPAGEESGGRFNHFCYALAESDWNALRERLAASRTAEEEGPVRRWGAHGYAISMYFRDPDGNLIEARYYPDDTEDGG
ncbi:VOC family protein [bacterium]|nr:VOC family protein [bacterium]